MRERDEKSGNVGCFILGVIGVMLPVLYVFSLGPAASLFYSGYLSAKTFNAIYAPLLWLGEHVRFVDNAIRWYIDIWVPTEGEV